MGETFGHVVPGVFYCMFAIILLFATRQHRNDPALATTYSREFRGGFGWGVAITAGTGFVIEGVGGVLHNGDFFLQFAHEVMYLAFFAAGAIALLESRGRLPNDSWRLTFGAAFFLEGSTFYGHMLEQSGVEAMLHFIMVMLSWFTAGSFFLACVYPKTLLPHVLGTTGMLAKGLWFFIISRILYSGAYGHEGEYLMIASGYTAAAMMVVIVFSLVGCCIFGRESGAYFDENLEVDDATPLQEKPPKKYAKVNPSTDA